MSSSDCQSQSPDPIRGWMHGDRESELYEIVSSRGVSTLTLGEKSHGNQVTTTQMELAEAIASADIQQVMALQLKRICTWFESAEDVCQDTHLKCYRSMLRKLTQPTWDLRGFQILTRLVLNHDISFHRFDNQILQTTQAIINQGPCDTDKSHVEVLELIGDVLGPEHIIRIFDQLGNHCTNPDCDVSFDGTKIVWQATAPFWSTKWAPSRVALKRTATYATSAALFQSLNRSDIYEPHLSGPIDEEVLHFVRNPEVCRHLLTHENAGVGLERTIGTDPKTALAFDAEWRHGGAIAAVLLEAGASSSAVWHADQINPLAAAALLQFDPGFARELEQPEKLEKLFRPDLFEGMHELARSLRIHGVRIPESMSAKWIAKVQDETDPRSGQAYTRLICAMHCAGLIPNLEFCRDRSSSWSDADKETLMRWSPHTHEFCSKRVQELVVRAVLVLKQAQPDLPQEMVSAILGHIVE